MKEFEKIATTEINAQMLYRAVTAINEAYSREVAATRMNVVKLKDQILEGENVLRSFLVKQLKVTSGNKKAQ